MGIKDILQRFSGKREKINELAEEMRIQRLAEERQLSSNERELQRFMKEDREDSIKKELEEFRNKRRQEFLHRDVITQPNIFRENNSILKQKNIFVGNSVQKERGLFFK